MKKGLSLNDLFMEVRKGVWADTNPGPGNTWINDHTGMSFVRVPSGCYQVEQASDEKAYLIEKKVECRADREVRLAKKYCIC